MTRKYIIPKVHSGGLECKRSLEVDFVSNRISGLFKAHQRLWINKAKMDVT